MPCGMCGKSTCECKLWSHARGLAGGSVHRRTKECDGQGCPKYVGEMMIPGLSGTKHSHWSECQRKDSICVPIAFKWGKSYEGCTCDWNDYGHKLLLHVDCRLHGENAKAQGREGQAAIVREAVGQFTDAVAAHADNDAVNHPSHYTSHPSGVECITVTEHYGFNVGNAIKYLWRAGLKNSTEAGTIEDLKKARWYIDREISRLTGSGEQS